jgi:hypothetical protein
MTAPARERPRHLRVVGAVEDRTGAADPPSPWPEVVAGERRGETRVLIGIFALVAVLMVVAIAWGMVSVGAAP